MEEHMREQEDRNKRRNNVVLYNIPEFDREDVDQRQEEDLNLCKDLFLNSRGKRHTNAESNKNRKKQK